MLTEWQYQLSKCNVLPPTVFVLRTAARNIAERFRKTPNPGIDSRPTPKIEKGRVSPFLLHRFGCVLQKKEEKLLS
jgi:hypothetical protein